MINQRYDVSQDNDDEEDLDHEVDSDVLDLLVDICIDRHKPCVKK